MSILSKLQFNKHVRSKLKINIMYYRRIEIIWYYEIYKFIYIYNKVIHCKIKILWIENLKYLHNMGSIMYHNKFNYYDKYINIYKLKIIN